MAKGNCSPCLILLFASCTPGPNTVEKTPDKDGHIAGFLSGLWHGFISPVTFIVSLFTKNVRIYEIHNNGGWYNFGFVLGAGLFLQGGILGSRQAKKRKKKRGMACFCWSLAELC